MKEIEKRDFIPNKTYRETYRELGSMKSSILEIDSLYDRLNNRIAELSVYMRHSDENISLYVEKMNKLKLYRTKLKFFRDTLQNAKEESWQSMKRDLEALFVKAECACVLPE